MHRFIGLTLLMGGLFLGLIGAADGRTSTQEASPEAMATHPIVGTWRFVRDFGEGPTVTYGIFHADGTYLQQAYVEGPFNFGAWEPSGERSADLRFRQLYMWDERVVEAEARYAFEVNEMGDALDGEGVYVSRYLDDGSLEYSFETTTPGTRITAAPLVPLETLIAETAPEATPVP